MTAKLSTNPLRGFHVKIYKAISVLDSANDTATCEYACSGVASLVVWAMQWSKAAFRYKIRQIYRQTAPTGGAFEVCF